MCWPACKCLKDILSAFPEPGSCPKVLQDDQHYQRNRLYSALMTTHPMITIKCFKQLVVKYINAHFLPLLIHLLPQQVYRRHRILCLLPLVDLPGQKGHYVRMLFTDFKSTFKSGQVQSSAQHTVKQKTIAPGPRQHKTVQVWTVEDCTDCKKKVRGLNHRSKQHHSTV